MSANLPRMLRSWIMVLDEMQAKHPEKKRLIRKGLRAYANWTVRRAVHRRQAATVFKLAGIAATRSPVLALGMVMGTAPATAFEALRWRLPIGRIFSRSQAVPALSASEAARFAVGGIFEG